MPVKEKPRAAGQSSSLARGITPSKTMEIAALAAKLKSEGRDIIALSAGELACAPPESATRGAHEALERNESRYTINTGLPELRQAICDKYAGEVNWKVSPAQVIVTHGAKQAIFNTLLALLNPGDEVVTFSPYWVSYPEQIRLTGARMVDIQTTLDDGFQVNPDMLSEALTDKTKLVILNSPNNPTGAVYPEATIRRVAQVCAERGIWLMSDEIYEKIVFSPFKHYSLAEAPEADLERVIMVNGFSKTYAMTGWRVGYAIGPEEIIKGAAKIQSHSTSNACSLSQYAALAALSADTRGENDSFFNGLVPELLSRRDRALELFAQAPHLRTVTPTGAFYLMLDVSGLFGRDCGGSQLNSAADVCRWFIEDLGVAVTPGEAFGAGEYLRVSYSPAAELVEEACRRIKAGVSKL
ncbi:MAG: pyridoxal phosphate-dependent aminotransferase [Candidatus Zixiibacteriota bacterium]